MSLCAEKLIYTGSSNSHYGSLSLTLSLSYSLTHSLTRGIHPPLLKAHRTIKPQRADLSVRQTWVHSSFGSTATDYRKVVPRLRLYPALELLNHILKLQLALIIWLYQKLQFYHKKYYLATVYQTVLLGECKYSQYNNTCIIFITWIF